MYKNNYYNYLSNPLLLLIIIVTLLYYLLFSNLGDNNYEYNNNNNYFKYIEILLWALFVVLIILNGGSYFFNVDISAKLKNIFTNKPELDIMLYNKGKEIEKEIEKEEVFNIPNNKYNYEDAKAICKSYDARLATWKEIDESFRKGADWCGYGWSEGQMALFPTQLDKWNKLQEIEGHENDCGRPGINGGYISNPNVKFGINCFGYKPEINENEEKLMLEHDIYPKTKKEIDFNKKVKDWKNNIKNILVSPFNQDRWYE